MMFTILLLSVIYGANMVQGQTTCTTLQPVFELPPDGTSTVFDNTVTSTSSLDCLGCSLVVSSFSAVLNTAVPSTPIATTTQAVTTSATFVCSPSPSTTSTPASLPSGPFPSPTASPLPSIDPTVQTFIDQLSTAFLYASIFSNDGDLAKLCSVINPASLSEVKNPSFNGTAVQNEVCALASIDFVSPSLAATIVDLNQRGVSYLATALFAIQVAGGYAGGPNLATLCTEIEATLIDNLFIGFADDVGTKVKDYVCSAASANGNTTTGGNCICNGSLRAK